MRARRGGFSLIELMVTIVVVSILMAIAVPSYLAQIRKSRRTEAKTALLDLAGREERYYTTSGTSSYTNSAANLGYAPPLTNTPLSNFVVGTGYYKVTVTLNAPPYTLGNPAYSIAAVPNSTDQMNDTACTQFTLDQTGLQSALGTDSANCWR